MRANDLAVKIVEKTHEDSVETFLQIRNCSKGKIGGQWRLYFSLGLSPIETEDRVKKVILDGRYGFIEPTPNWKTLDPGALVEIQVENWLFSGMQLVARQGFHLVELVNGGEKLLGAPLLLEPLLAPLKSTRAQLAKAQREKQFLPGSKAFEHDDIEIVPAIKTEYSTQNQVHSAGFYVVDCSLENEANHLKKLLIGMGVSGKSTPIYLRLDSKLRSSYRLETIAERVTIVGQDEQTVFYGIQTFRQLIGRHTGGCSFPIVKIEDTPDFEHRAFFIDIARHFQPLTQIKKTVEAMSTYKMNRLQLGISNDEGWRLAIQSIPELTEVGARRSYSRYTTEGVLRALYPAWGDDHHDYEGFLSREDFVSLLKHAKEHHVEVILEFNLPGHANAFIQSVSQNDQWRLVDPEDTSQYRSAQGYTNNVINVGMEDNYRMAKIILEEIKSLYEEAHLPLTRIHLGGDEVPFGAWLHSPACRRLPVWNPKWDVDVPKHAKEATQQLMAYHHKKITGIVDQVSPGTQTGFWHDMSAAGKGNNHNDYYNVWLTSDAKTETINPILDREQSLIISNASLLYLDMPYTKQFDEPGLPWAGYVDTKSIYHFNPCDSWGLKASQSRLVLGIQAQLWSETVFSAELMDYYTFPRLLAVAERAWNSTAKSDRWALFRRALTTRELPHLDTLGVKYRKKQLEE